MPSLKATILSAPAVLAAILNNRCPAPKPTPPTTRELFPTTSTASVLTTANEPPSCDYTYCDEHGSKWCYFWDGVTAYDLSKGVVPAETRVPLGPCHDGK